MILRGKFARLRDAALDAIGKKLPGKTFRLPVFMVPILSILEPFALATWKNEIIDWVPAGLRPKYISKETLFGGLYQKVTMIR